MLLTTHKFIRKLKKSVDETYFMVRRQIGTRQSGSLKKNMARRSPVIWIILLVVVVGLVYQLGKESPSVEQQGMSRTQQQQCKQGEMMINGRCCADRDNDGLCDGREIMEQVYVPPFTETLPEHDEQSFPQSSVTFPVKSVSTNPGSSPVFLGGIVGVDDDSTLGNEEAPVVVIEFSNYECIPCVQSYKHIFPKLKSDYIDTGKVLYVARDYVYESGTSHGAFKAAIAANCAREQDRYWEMRDLLFTYTKKFSLNALVSYAKNLDLDVVSFRSCLEGGYKDEVVDDYQDGKDAGMKAGSSMFYVNGFVVTSGDYDMLEMTIENVLSGKWS